jgi:predicted RNA binding protein YcfA (HicA-like mRNA interferase family)
MPEFPSMKARALLAVLTRAPLNYRIVRQNGSHRHLVAEGRGRILFSAHDRKTIPPGLVRKYLVNDAGLSVDEALDLLKG